MQPVPGNCTPGAVAVSTNFRAASPTFTIKTVTGAPSANPIQIAIDPENTDRVVVVYPGFSGTPVGALSRHVFMTTDGGTTWADIGGTASTPTAMVPDLPLYSVVIDPQTSPHSIIVSTDLGVAAHAQQRRDVAGARNRPAERERDVAPDRLLRDAVAPSRRHVRSQRVRARRRNRAALGVNCDLGFGLVDVGTSDTRQCELFNVGSTDLHVIGFFRSAGSPEFTITSGPATPVTIQPGEHLDYTIQFAHDRGQQDGDVPGQQRRPVPAEPPDSRERNRESAARSR